MEDFTKKKPRPLMFPASGKMGPGANTPLEKLAEIDLLKEGLFSLPGPQGAREERTVHELVGVDHKNLGDMRTEWQRARAQLLRDINSEWTCVRCKHVQMGRNLKLKKPKVSGEEGTYACVKCDGEVIRSRDAMDLQKLPRGKVVLP